MDRQYRVREILRGGIRAVPLDGAGDEELRLPRPKRFIENEVLVVSSRRGEAAEAGGADIEVSASRIDPTYLEGNRLRLEDFGDEDFEFEDGLDFEEFEDFQDALEDLRAGGYVRAGKKLRSFLSTHPQHIDSYHHLGVIEWERGSVTRSLKYYEMGYRIGLASLPEGFDGDLPWGCIENRPFLRAAHGYALALRRKRRHVEACEILERILELNPNDNQGIRHLLPTVYFEARAPEKARELLRSIEPDGMNCYTRSLLELIAGRTRDALRWLCAGVSYNPHFPLLVLDRAAIDAACLRADGYTTSGGPDEALSYDAEMGKYWQKEGGVEFVRKVLEIPSFRSRFDRVHEIGNRLEGLEAGPERSSLVHERFSIFGEDSVSEIVDECRKIL